MGLLQHRQPLPLAGQITGVDPALHRQLLRQVGEREQRDAVRPELPHQREGGAGALRCLQGQATDQIDVDALEFGLTHPGHRTTQLIDRHQPVDGALHQRVGVLNPVADAAEAQASQMQHRVTIEQLGIHLDRGLQIALQFEAAGHQLPKPCDLVAVEIIGCAAAPVQLSQRTPGRAQLIDQFQFPCQGLEIGSDRPGSGLGGDAVAAAIPAGMPAEGHMHVQGDRISRELLQLALQIRRTDPLAEGSGGRIAGVARHRPVVLQQQFQRAIHAGVLVQWRCRKDGLQGSCGEGHGLADQR